MCDRERTKDAFIHTGEVLLPSLFSLLLSSAVEGGRARCAAMSQHIMLFKHASRAVGGLIRRGVRSPSGTAASTLVRTVYHRALSVLTPAMTANNATVGIHTTASTVTKTTTATTTTTSARFSTQSSSQLQSSSSSPQTTPTQPVRNVFCNGDLRLDQVEVRAHVWCVVELVPSPSVIASHGAGGHQKMPFLRSFVPSFLSFFFPPFASRT